MSQKVSREPSIQYIVAEMLCFAVLGLLVARHVSPGAAAAAAFAVYGLLFYLLSLAVMILAMNTFHQAISRQAGAPLIRSAVARGFLLIIPFAALALIAEVLLNWNAVQAFASAGIMTAGAAIGMEVIKLGGGRIANAVVPSLGAFALSALWLFVSGLLQKLGGGW